MIDLIQAFATITAMIEDMHGVAVNGQAKDLSPDEGMAFVAMLRSEIAGLELQVTAVSEAFNL